MSRDWGDFDRVVVIDYEYREGGRNPPDPICYSYLDCKDSKVKNHWIDGTETEPEYPIDDNTLIVAYYAIAEMSSHLALGFDIPNYILDLFCEFRVKTNGKKLWRQHPNSLIGAGAYHGLKYRLPKTTMQQMIKDNIFYNPLQKKQIIEYCNEDVLFTRALLQQMIPDIDNLPQALLRGRYMASMASVEANGIPLNIEKLDMLILCWDTIKNQLIDEISPFYDIFENGVFKRNKFAAFLEREGIPWGTTPTGKPKTDQEYMEEQAKIFPVLKPLQETLYTLNQMKLNNLNVGRDNRNRFMSSPFGAVTGRNTPSTAKSIFGPATWIRCLIQPEKGKTLAYIDYRSQEIMIAASLSGDGNFKKDYRTGDPYLSLAIIAGAAPPNATKKTHGDIRETYKTADLALGYGQGVYSLSNKLQKTRSETKYVVDWHKRRYRDYWNWINTFADGALLKGEAISRLGWKYHTKNVDRRSQLLNWPMQTAASDILHLAVPACIGRGIKVVGTLHDALLIESNNDRIEADVKTTQYCMETAALFVVGEIIDTDVKLIKYPDHFVDKRGVFLWNKIWDIINNMHPDQINDLRLEKIRLSEVKKTKQTKVTDGLTKQRRSQISMRPMNITEREMVARIRKKSGLTHIEIMHLVNLSRDTDYDLEFCVDWSLNYDQIKQTVLEGVNPLNRSIKDLNGGIQ